MFDDVQDNLTTAGGVAFVFCGLVISVNILIIVFSVDSLIILGITASHLAHGPGI